MKKLKEDNAIAVRTDRQQSELRALNADTIYLTYNNNFGKYLSISEENVQNSIKVQICL